VDVSILGDVDGNGVVNAADGAQVLLRSRSASTALLPPIPLLPVALPAALRIAAPTDSGATPMAASASTGGGTASGTSVNMAGSFSNFSVVPATSPTLLPASGLRVLPDTASAGVSA